MLNKKVGFIGLGVMGTAFVRRLLEMKVVPIVYDVVPEKVQLMVSQGAISAGSPKEVAAQTDVVMTSLPDPAVVNQVYTGKDGIIEGVRPGMVIFDFSTVDPDTSRENYKKFAQKAVSLLDSPVSGGPPEIIEGRLPSIIVGGDKEVFEQNIDCLKFFSSNIHYVGGSGCGNVVKLTNNLISLTHNAIAAEAMVFGTKAGVDPDVLHNILSHSGCRSFHLVYMYPNLMKRNFKPGFRLDLGKKDVGLGACRNTCSWCPAKNNDL
jgi:2-hydroxy-3-oxopropionate reductase